MWFQVGGQVRYWARQSPNERGRLASPVLGLLTTWRQLPSQRGTSSVASFGQGQHPVFALLDEIVFGQAGSCDVGGLAAHVHAS